MDSDYAQFGCENDVHNTESLSYSVAMPGLLEFNVGGRSFTSTVETISTDKQSSLYLWYIERKGPAHLSTDKNGAYFIDRDPDSFSVVLNYLRLRRGKQMWEVCMPKDPDRLALLTQEAEFYRLPALKEQAIALLQVCTEKSGMNGEAYVNEVLSKTTSCPQGFDIKALRFGD